MYTKALSLIIQTCVEGACQQGIYKSVSTSASDRGRVEGHLGGWFQSTAEGAWERRQRRCFCLIDSVVTSDVGGGGGVPGYPR